MGVGPLLRSSESLNFTTYLETLEKWVIKNYQDYLEQVQDQELYCYKKTMWGHIGTKT